MKKSRINKKNISMLLLILGFLILLFGNLFIDPVRSIDFPKSWQHFNDVVYEIRFIRTAGAIVAGAGLALCGLLMQIWFQNPLAGPYLLGIQSGAQLAMTIWIIAFGSYTGDYLKFSSVGVSIVGSMTILSLISYWGKKMGDELMIILLGVLVGSLCSGLSNAMLTLVDSITLKSFFTWNLGSFSNFSDFQVLILSSVLAVSVGSIFLFKNDIDALQLGTLHAVSLGVDVSKLRSIIFIMVGILSGLITAYCGPLVFLGVISPHVARWILKTAMIKQLMIGTLFIGATISLFAQLVQNMTAPYFFAVNSTLNFFAGPVLIFILLRVLKRIRVVA